MNRTKKRIIAATVIFLVLLLIPVPMYYKDGGTVDYKAVLYSVRKEHSIAGTPGEEGFNIGTRIKLLGWEVYDDVKFVPINREDI